MYRGLNIRNDETYVPIKGPIPYNGDNIIDYSRGSLIRFEDRSSMINALSSLEEDTAANSSRSRQALSTQTSPQPKEQKNQQ